jgi:hypothetical protein
MAGGHEETTQKLVAIVTTTPKGTSELHVAGEILATVREAPNDELRPFDLQKDLALIPDGPFGMSALRDSAKRYPEGWAVNVKTGEAAPKVQKAEGEGLIAALMFLPAILLLLSAIWTLNTE